MITMNQGLMSLGLSQPPFNIYSFWGIVWAHIGANVSVKVMLLAPGFRNMDASLEEEQKFPAPRIASRAFNIVMPVMTPAILVTTSSA